MESKFNRLVKKFISIMVFSYIIVLAFAGCSNQSSAQMAVDSELDSIVLDDSYKDLSDDEKLEKIVDKLETLEENGQIAKDSLKVDENEYIVSFEYTDNTLGGVSIKQGEEDKYDSAGSLSDSYKTIPVIKYNTESFGSNDNMTVPQYDSGGSTVEYTTNAFDSDEDMPVPEYNTDRPSIEYTTDFNNDISDAPSYGSVIQSDSTALILNAFENTAFRRDFYNSLKTDWDGNHLLTTLDNEVTVRDMMNIADYDVVVFAMHGNTYNGSPAMVINEKVTKKTDKSYSSQRKNKEIARLLTTGSDGNTSYKYWILPEFFNVEYAKESMGAKLVYAQSCKFFGCDCYNKSIDYTLGNAVKDASGGVVVGYHNSVLSEYGRNVMAETVKQTMNGMPVSSALDEATDVYGTDDNYESSDPEDDKYIAYPFICGDSSQSVTKVSAESFTIDDSIDATVGENSVIEPQVMPQGATDYSIEWTSSDEDVATVTPQGKNCIISAKSVGKTTVTAKMKSGKKQIKQETTINVYEKSRDTVLVLDISGSMEDDPIDEMKKAAKSFCEEQLNSNANNRIGIVFYDTYVDKVDLTNDLSVLEAEIDDAYASGGTDMTYGMRTAAEMLDNDGKENCIKNMVIMADGLPNEGDYSLSGKFDTSYSYDAQYANGVSNLAEDYKNYYNIYSLGFFHNIDKQFYAEEYNLAVDLMKSIATTETDYHLVEKAEELQFAFGDIQDTISDGSRIIINIACPVDVTIEYDNDVLTSDNYSGFTKTTFGEIKKFGENEDIKVVTLLPGKDYDIKMNATGYGSMNYTVNYTNSDGVVTDYRIFDNVPLTKTTLIQSNTNNKDNVELNVDNDGDGKTDAVWTAAGNSIAEDPNATVADEKGVKKRVKTSSTSKVTVIIVCVSVALILLIAIIVISVTVSKNKKEAKSATKAQVSINPPVNNFVQQNYLKHVANHSITISVNNSLYGSTYILHPNQIIYVGRDYNKVQIVIPENCAHCARVHCSIFYNDQMNKYVVEAISKNGIWDAAGNKLAEGKNYINPNSVLVLPDGVKINLC